MRAVGRHEVDQRARVLEELAELVPAGVGLHRRVLGAAGIELGEDLVAHQVERRHAGVAAAREVDGGQVERQAEQIVPERAGDELVDLVGDLVDRAEHDLAGGGGAMRGELERIEERIDQADRVQDRLAGRRINDRRAVSADLVAVDVLVQHRVAEAIDGVRELGRDRRVEMDVVVAEQMDVRRHLARELLEHQVLVLRLGAELGDLEQPFAIPFVGLDDVDGIAVDVDTVGDREVDARQHPIASKRRVAIVELGLDLGLDHVDLAVVLGMEDVVDRGQRDVLVGAAVAGDVVRVEQLVVVECRAGRRAAGAARHPLAPSGIGDRAG